MANPANLRDFQPGDDPRRNIAGRPKKWVTLLKADGYKLSEIIDTYMVCLSLTMDDLKVVYEAKDSTSLERTVAFAIRKAFDRGELDILEKMITRAHGGPTQKMDTVQRITIINDF